MSFAAEAIAAQWTPVDTRMNCDVHRDMFWYDDQRRCWACHPGEWQEPEGTREYTGLVPDPAEEITPLSTGCVVFIPNEMVDGEHHCQVRFNGKTILGHPICDACYAAVSA